MITRWETQTATSPDEFPVNQLTHPEETALTIWQRKFSERETWVCISSSGGEIIKKNCCFRYRQRKLA